MFIMMPETVLSSLSLCQAVRQGRDKLKFFVISSPERLGIGLVDLDHHCICIPNTNDNCNSYTL